MRLTETERLGPFRSRSRVAGNKSSTSASEYISPSRSAAARRGSACGGVGGRGINTGLEVVWMRFFRRVTVTS